MLKATISSRLLTSRFLWGISSSPKIVSRQHSCLSQLRVWIHSLPCPSLHSMLLQFLKAENRPEAPATLRLVTAAARSLSLAPLATPAGAACSAAQNRFSLVAHSKRAQQAMNRARIIGADRAQAAQRPAPTRSLRRASQEGSNSSGHHLRAARAASVTRAEVRGPRAPTAESVEISGPAILRVPPKRVSAGEKPEDPCKAETGAAGLRQPSRGAEATRPRNSANAPLARAAAAKEQTRPARQEL